MAALPGLEVHRCVAFGMDMDREQVGAPAFLRLPAQALWMCWRDLLVPKCDAKGSTDACGEGGCCGITGLV